MRRARGSLILIYFDVAIFVVSIAVLVPSLIRARGEWRNWLGRRRMGEGFLLAGLVAVPVLTFWQGVIEYQRDAPRHLTEVQIAIFHTYVDEFKGQKVLVVADTRGDDSHDLAEAIYAQFIEAGWEPQADPAERDTRPGVLDVTLIAWGPCETQIDVADDQRIPRAAQGLFRAFDAMEMQPCVRRTKLPPKWIRLVVRRKEGG